MNKSLFTPLHEEGLTTLRLRYNWKTDKFFLFAAKDWEDDLDFSLYNQDFYTDSLLTENAIYLNDYEVRQIFEKYNLYDYLLSVLDLIRLGRHNGIECFYNKKFNIHFMGNIHTRKLGINNRSHAISCGGIRRHGFEDEEIEVIKDGLNLSRAMTYKNIAADLAYGGCKTTVHMDEVDLNNLEMLGFLAYCLDILRCNTGPDMGFPTELADKMNELFSVQFAGGPNGPIGPTGKPTAYGVYLALKEAVKIEYGTEKLDGLSIAVQGLGSVGWPMCEYLLQEDVKLFVTDANPSLMQKLKDAYPDRAIEVVKTDEILILDADVFCPCAIGGIITEEIISSLKFKIIMGGANNQLRASSNEEEIRLSNLLMENGILYQESWWHNTGGVMGGIEEYENGSNASLDRLRSSVEKVVALKTRQNLHKAKDLGISPTDCMYRTCNKIIYG